MTNPVKNFNFLKYPYGDCAQWHSENPKLYASMGLAGHNGIDIVRSYGEHIFAVESGIVCDLKSDPGGYGKHIRILSKSGNVYNEWTYGHLSHISAELGQEVKEGQFVGTMGNTGFVVSGNTPYWGFNPYAGTHLHLTKRRVQKSPTGWKYPYQNSIKVEVLDYNNGFKGSVDSLEDFSTPQALRIARLADLNNSAVYWRAANVLRIIQV